MNCSKDMGRQLAEAAIDPAEIDAAVLADKLADPLQQAEADRASADEAMLRIMLRESM